VSAELGDFVLAGVFVLADDLPLLTDCFAGVFVTTFFDGDAFRLPAI
jgi:hypothetical protein